MKGIKRENLNEKRNTTINEMKKKMEITSKILGTNMSLKDSFNTEKFENTKEKGSKLKEQLLHSLRIAEEERLAIDEKNKTKSKLIT
jgi:hypothetical protein